MCLDCTVQEFHKWRAHNSNIYQQCNKLDLKCGSDQVTLYSNFCPKIETGNAIIFPLKLITEKTLTC